MTYSKLSQDFRISLVEYKERYPRTQWYGKTGLDLSYATQYICEKYICEGTLASFKLSVGAHSASWGWTLVLYSTIEMG